MCFLRAEELEFRKNGGVLCKHEEQDERKVGTLIGGAFWIGSYHPRVKSLIFNANLCMVGWVSFSAGIAFTFETQILSHLYSVAVLCCSFLSPPFNETKYNLLFVFSKNLLTHFDSLPLRLHH